MTANVASLVISNLSLRWSSPLIFNDPFDVPRELIPGVNAQELVEAVARRHAALIEQPPDDTSSLTPKLQSLIDSVKNGITNDHRSALIASLREAAKAIETKNSSLEEFRQMWRESLPDLRILCLTDSPSHLAMWYHYAESYTGVVLEFACNDILDSAWLAAQPVTYPEEKPEVYTLNGLAELMTTKTEIAVKKLLHVSTYTKAPDWSYEREWRIVTFKRPTNFGLFTDYRFDPRELATIFLGPLISSEDKFKLKALAAQYPHVRVVEVSLGLSRELVFNEIPG